MWYTIHADGGSLILGNTDKFELIASRYDTPERIQIAKASADAIREYIVDGRKKSAVDFGCGTGLVGVHLIDDFQSVLFLDTSQNMIRQIDRKIADLRIPNADTLCFDFEKADRPDIRADYIFMAQVLLHIRDVELVLSRLYDVLLPGGHVVIVDFNKNEDIVSDIVHNGFDQEELAGVMRNIGFSAVQSKTFYTGSGIFMGRDASMFVMDARK